MGLIRKFIGNKIAEAAIKAGHVPAEIPANEEDRLKDLKRLKLIEKNLILSSHDVSNGGLITAISEMSIGSGYGAKIFKPKKLTNVYEYFFGEDQARYIIEVNNKHLSKVDKILKDNNVFYDNIGMTQSDFFEIEDEFKINVKDLFKINNEWYNSY